MTVEELPEIVETFNSQRIKTRCFLYNKANGEHLDLFDLGITDFNVPNKCALTRKLKDKLCSKTGEWAGMRAAVGMKQLAYVKPENNVMLLIKDTANLLNMFGIPVPVMITLRERITYLLGD